MWCPKISFQMLLSSNHSDPHLVCGWKEHLQTPSSTKPIPAFNQNPDRSLRVGFCSSENTAAFSSAPSTPHSFLSSGTWPHQAFHFDRDLGFSNPKWVGRERRPIIFRKWWCWQDACTLDLILASVHRVVKRPCTWIPMMSQSSSDSTEPYS